MELFWFLYIDVFFNTLLVLFASSVLLNGRILVLNAVDFFYLIFVHFYTLAFEKTEKSKAMFEEAEKFHVFVKGIEEELKKISITDITIKKIFGS